VKLNITIPHKIKKVVNTAVKTIEIGYNSKNEKKYNKIIHKELKRLSNLWT